ncbi:MAG: TonB-dependent receptor [Gammaproteobacteria bacterium]|nr:TonB-dependent receptor [Gammaproteobacteria bacterium]
MKYSASIGFTSLLAFLWSTAVIGAELEEVVVTALKRDQSLQEVPLSVSALTGSDLDSLSLSDMADVTQQIPNFQVNTWSPNLTTFNIRGVSQNNFIDINEAPIAVYVDDVYMGSMNGISGLLFDINRVEVLRGPQGTLFGRNATGGLVHYVTRGAEDTEFNARYAGSAGSFNSFSQELTLGGAFGNPRYRYRLATKREASDGYIESAPASAVTADAKPKGNLGGKDNLALRLTMQFDVTDNLRIDYGYKFTRDPRVATGGYSFLPFGDSANSHIPPEWFGVARNIMENPDLSDADAEQFLRNAFFTAHPDGTPSGRGGEEATADRVYDGNFANDGFVPISEEGLTTFRGDSPKPFVNYSDYEGFLNRTTLGNDLKFHYTDDNNNSFSYISAWYRLDKFYTEDGDGLPAQIINFTTTMEYEQLTQEFRFSTESDAGHHYVAGLYFMDLDYDGGAVTVGAPVNNEISNYVESIDIMNPEADQNFFLGTANFALFAEGDFRISDSFSMIFGMRYTRDSKSINYFRNLTNDGIAVTDPASVFSIEDEFELDDYAGRLIFNLHLGSENQHNLYLSFNRGVKSGGFNASATVNAETIRYDSEVLYSTELGFKSNLSSSLRFSFTAFNYNYDDYQAFSIRNGTPSISNADASARGAELDLKWTPNRFVIGFGMAFMLSDVDGVQGIDSQFPPGGLPEIDIPIKTLNNRSLPNAPKLSFNLLVSYDILIGSSSNLILQMDGAWYDDQYLEVTNGAGAFQSVYSVLNFSMIWRSAFGKDDNHSFEAKLFAKNLTDKIYKAYNLDLGILGSTAYYAPPQSFGFLLAYGFR